MIKKITMKDLKDYLPYYIGQKCMTPDGIGTMQGLPWAMKCYDRVHVHFGKRMVKTENSIDGGFKKTRNHGDYAIAAQRYEPIGSSGITEDGFDMPGGVVPILRRLSDMTESDMIGLLQSMVPPDMKDTASADYYSVTMFYNDNGLMVDGDVIVGADYSVICYEGQIAIRECGSIMLFGEDGNQERPVNIVQGFHYLLKQGFDLFNLIDEGLAVDSKTISTKQQ
jgi:hypothetical protein